MDIMKWLDTKSNLIGEEKVILRNVLKDTRVGVNKIQSGI